MEVGGAGSGGGAMVGCHRVGQAPGEPNNTDTSHQCTQLLEILQYFPTFTQGFHSMALPRNHCFGVQVITKITQLLEILQYFQIFSQGCHSTALPRNHCLGVYVITKGTQLVTVTSSDILSRIS